jgi:mitogen-activated protein kinase kinase kinase 7
VPEFLPFVLVMTLVGMWQLLITTGDVQPLGMVAQRTIRASAAHRRLALSDRSTSDIAQQLYLRYFEDAEATQLYLTSIPSDVDDRLVSTNLSFSDLPDTIQCGLLWDTGYAIDTNRNPVAIWTLDNQSMADIMVPYDTMNTAGCSYFSCEQPDGFIAKSNQYCTGDQMLSAARCIAMTDSDSVDYEVHQAMWSVGGSASMIPEINLLEHSWQTENVTCHVMSIHTASLNSEPDLGECPDSDGFGDGYGSIVIPCFPDDSLSDDIASRMKKPVTSSLVDDWITDWVAKNRSSSSSSSGHDALADTPTPSTGSFDKLLLVLILIGCALVVAMAAFIYRRRRLGAHHDTGSALQHLWNDEQIIAVGIPREKVTFDRLLSRGGFGEVYTGRYNEQPIAIKMLLASARKDMRQVEGLLSEAKLMATLEHPNIVQLIGVAWDSLADLCLMLELMPNGDLRSLLNEYQRTGHEHGFDSDKLRIAHNVAHTLVYLHSLVTTRMKLRSPTLGVRAQVEVTVSSRTRRSCGSRTIVHQSWPSLASSACHSTQVAAPPPPRPCTDSSRSPRGSHTCQCSTISTPSSASY